MGQVNIILPDHWLEVLKALALKRSKNGKKITHCDLIKEAIRDKFRPDKSKVTVLLDGEEL